MSDERLTKDVDLISKAASMGTFAPDEESPKFDKLTTPLTADQRSAWVPSLNPTQLDIFHDDKAWWMLAYGERASGKSIAMLHKLVKHCFEEFNALAIVIVGIKRTALEGGAWHKLVYDVLPQWKEGIGLQYTDSKTSVAKDDYLYIQNKWGTYSKVLLVSMPVHSFVRERVRGLEPSLVFADELTTLQTDIYFSAIIQQLRRRPHIRGQQQYLAATNPEGPSHWVYKRFFVKPRNQKTGEWDKRYSVYHVPISENEKNMPPGYYDAIKEGLRDDPVEEQRLIHGKWVDRPQGDSIFFGYYDQVRHVKGNPEKGTRIIPRVGNDIILGFDLGTANSAVIFLQNIPTKDKDLWIAFDEMVYTSAYVQYPILVPAILRRIAFWNERCKTVFNVQCWSDSSAFNMYRAGTGSYDSWDVQRISAEAAKDFKDVQPLNLRETPKFPGSVPARVKMIMKYLQQDRLLISASCEKLQQTFMFLETEREKTNGKYVPERPFLPARSKYLHAFDALSYGIFPHELSVGLYKEPTIPMELMPIGVEKR